MEPADLASVAAASDRPTPHIHVVDDDASVRSAIVRLLGAAGFEATAHPSAESFLDASDPQAAWLPRSRRRAARRRRADAAAGARRARQPHADHFPDRARRRADVRPGDEARRLRLPDQAGRRTVLLAAIEQALVKDLLLRQACLQRAATESLLATLTPREREVLTHVMAGRLNKQIAADLGTAEKTVKVHRARGMEKMQVRSVAELVRIVERAHMQ